MDWQRQLMQLLNLPTSRDARMPASGLPMALAGVPLKGLAEGAKAGLGAVANMAGITGQIARGNEVPRDTAIEGATKMGMGIMDMSLPGPSPGGTNIGMLMGRHAAHAPIPSIQAAQGARAGGADLTDIWLAQGVDVTDMQRPRWEIADNNAQVNEDLVRRLAQEQSQFKTPGSHTPVEMRDVMDHPELWSNYPALARAPFEMMNPGSGYHGQFAPAPYNWKNKGAPAGVVRGSASLIDPVTGKSNMALGSTLLHELQHGVQWIEGHPMGANPKLVAEQARKAALDRLTTLYSNNVRDPEAQKLQAMWHKYSQNPDIKRQVDFLLYKGSPGEIEARNTQERRWWMPAERAIMAPWQSADMDPIPGSGTDPIVPWWKNQWALNRP